MNNYQRIQSTFDANNQILQQQGDCHYCLHTASIGFKHKSMKKTGFEDFDLLYKGKSKEKFIEAIGEEPRSTVYVKVFVYETSSKAKLWNILTWAEFIALPQDWKTFKKLI
jgi:hypothetical protein